jgi:cell division protein YceG involved in septum cleavage
MRAVVDRFVSWLAVVVAAVLLVAGGLLVWAHEFIGDQVHSQLSQQQITMPGGAALTTPQMKQELGKYAGQQMTTGAQAKAYANYFIGAHLKEMGGGKTYSQISTEQMAAAAKDPNSAQATKLATIKQEMFQGNTLRGLLLYGYAFATMGTIAGIAAVASFVGAVLLLVLAGLGLWHATRTTRTTTAPVTPGPAATA